MLGKIYEQKDWKGKAIEHYNKSLILWTLPFGRTLILVLLRLV